MTRGDLAELVRIAQAFLDPDRQLQDLLAEAQSLRDMLENRTGFQLNPEGGIGAGETRLDSGLAISPTTAAMCARELLRTSTFIRGLGAAIQDSLGADRPVRVLYAGCGPYALLALPLMTLFSREQAVFTLLDIHRQCLDDAMKLVASLGLSDRVKKSICTDAARYEIPTDEIPDVIVSETMSVTLHNEPQVAIARNLLAQAPYARMVPQSVSVEACVLDQAKEHLFLSADHTGEIPESQRDRVYLGKIFELDAAGIRSWAGITADRLPAGRITLPAPLEDRYRPHLLTRITVYGDTRLQDYETSLTLPKPLPGKFHGGEEVQFHYQLGNDPELRYEILAPQDGRPNRSAHSGAHSLFRRRQPAAAKTRYLRLPFTFDVVRLNADLAQIRETEWIAHANTDAYDKEWRCAPLRSVDGRSDHILSLPDMRYEDTALLARCPYFRKVIDTFECEITSARLMAMGAGCHIKPHRDAGTSFGDGVARLHIPIATTPEVLFSIEGEEIHFSAGHAWYLNANCLHGVHNGSPLPRIHLMLDCIVNPWLEQVFMEAGFEPEDKPKYGDPAINDDNVGAIIAKLMAMDNGAGKLLADKLAALQNAGVKK